MYELLEETYELVEETYELLEETYELLASNFGKSVENVPSNGLGCNKRQMCYFSKTIVYRLMTLNT